jgi:excisionase family DNA binding protein
MERADQVAWLTVTEAAARARCGPKTIYREVARRHLRAAVVGGRRALRFRPEWVDEWLDLSAPAVSFTPHVIASRLDG